VQPSEPGSEEPVEVEERGSRVVVILLIAVAVVFGLVVLIAILAPD
jgi:hypothetical protein